MKTRAVEDDQVIMVVFREREVLTLTRNVVPHRLVPDKRSSTGLVKNEILVPNIVPMLSALTQVPFGN